MLGRPEVASQREHPGRGGIRGSDNGELEQTSELSYVEHIRLQGDVAGWVDAVVAVSANEPEQSVDLPHAGPGQLGLEQASSELADGCAMAVGFASEEVEVAKGVGRFVLGKVAAIDGPLTWGNPRVRLDEHVFVVEADRGAVGSSAQFSADEVRGKRVQGFGNLSEVVAADLGVAPEGNVVRLRRSVEKYESLFSLEVLQR